ncbi:MAG: hypothetical protein ACRD3C_12040 [Vicinamibacterales bacterium]
MTALSVHRPARTRSGDLWWATTVLIFAGAVLLRLPGLSTDLWLDEVWSLQGALEAQNWQHLLLQRKIDNNHHLNSLYLYFVGPQSNAVVYRLLAFVSGVGTLTTAWLIGARDSRLTATVTVLLFGSSYLMVFYASEARGYATVVWLTLAAWYCVTRYAEAPRARWAAGFAACSVLGVMAHQTFVMFFAGAYVWFDAHLQWTQQTLRAVTRATRRLFLAPTILIAVYYLIAVFGQEVGGGPPFRPVTVVAQTLSAIGGGPQVGVGLWTAGTLVAAVFILSMRSAHRLGDDRWLLYLVAGFVIPAILTVARQPPTLSPRYFIVPTSVLLLGASVWLSRKLTQGGAAMVGAAALVAAHMTGGVLHTMSDAASRGHYREALRRMVASSTNEEITVASADRYGGHDFRAGTLIGYYSRALAAEGRIRYVTAEEYPLAGADWMIVETLGEPPRPSVMDRVGHTFALTDVYPAGDLSGTTWYVYRRRLPG